MNEELYIIANWKMNPQTLDEALGLANLVKEGVANIEGKKVVLCPPFPFLSHILPSEHVEMGAQNCFWEDKGPYTGEVSASMVQGLGCSYVIIGHSERKTYLNEDPKQIAAKLQAAFRANITPVLCIGEKQKTTEGNFLDIAVQMKDTLEGLQKGQMLRLLLVYEPEWAISSNKNAQAATPEDCKNSIQYMRETVEKMFGKDIAELTRILYGGSTNSGNIGGFIQAGAAGALVGSVSLDANEFVSLVRNAQRR